MSTKKHDWLKMTAKDRAHHRERCSGRFPSDTEAGYAVDLLDDLEEALRRLDIAQRDLTEERQGR